MPYSSYELMPSIVPDVVRLPRPSLAPSGRWSIANRQIALVAVRAAGSAVTMLSTGVVPHRCYLLRCHLWSPGREQAMIGSLTSRSLESATVKAAPAGNSPVASAGTPMLGLARKSNGIFGPHQTKICRDRIHNITPDGLHR